MARTNYEEDKNINGYYKVDGYGGIAFYVLGWETQPNEDTEWTGEEERTGKVIVVMVGDDREHFVDFEELTPLEDDEFCAGCGQIGCHCG